MGRKGNERKGKDGLGWDEVEKSEDLVEGSL